MTKRELYQLVNFAAEEQSKGPISREQFTQTLSVLEVQGYIQTIGDEVVVLKEYPGGN